MSNLVIVAVPAENDRVWKISSEKVPHLTLLFLGDADNSKLEQIMLFVEHAVNLCEHGPFYLDVDHRGTLGPDEADVLFFNKRSWNLKWIKQFRGQLLQNQDIKTAYDSVPIADQYPEWTPHLTLGYPATPAKPIPDDGFDHPIYSVEFDRIAVWTGDYEGPEFRLEWPERDWTNEDVAVAYGDTGEAAVADILRHHGVKGMRWGRRKEPSVIERPKNNLTPKQTAGLLGAVVGGAVTLPPLGALVGFGAANLHPGIRTNLSKNREQDKEFQKDRKWEKSFKKDKKFADVHNGMADHMNSWLPGHNKKYENVDLTKDPAKMKEYEDAYLKEQTASFARSYSKVYGSSPSGKYKVSVIPGTDKVVLHNAKVDPGEFKHAADTEEPLMTFRLTQDKDTWHILKVEAVADSITQTTDLGSQFVLEHQSALDDPTLAEQIKAKIRSILDDVTGDADKDLSLFGDPLIRTKLQSVLEDFYKNPNANKALAYDALGAIFLEHVGIKGMRWGVRNKRPAPTAVAPTATSKVPHGTRRKTKIQTDGGENHPAHEDAIKVAKAQAKLKKSGTSALSNQELRDVATRVQLENQVTLLTGSKGKMFVRKHLGNQGDALAREGLREGVRNAPSIARRARRGAAVAATTAALL